jgi:hypothetical protein
MSLPQPTYSFLDVMATLTGPGGVAILGNGSGAAEEGITIEPIEEKDTMHIGADGSGAHSLHASKAARVTVRLMKTSLTNIILINMYNYQTASSLFHGKNIMVISNITTGEIYTCTGVAFARMPPNAYTKEAGVIDWEFNCIRAEMGPAAVLNI